MSPTTLPFKCHKDLVQPQFLVTVIDWLEFALFVPQYQCSECV